MNYVMQPKIDNIDCTNNWVITAHTEMEKKIQQVNPLNSFYNYFGN